MPRTLSDGEVEDFRLALVEAATRRFSEQGRAGLTLRGLADEVGCSRMTPYRYFGNKEGIVAAVRAHAFDELATATERAARRGATPVARLEAGGRAYLRFAARKPEMYRLMFAEPASDANAHPIFGKQIGRHRERMEAWSRDAIEAGELHGDPTTSAQLFWAGMHGVIMLELAGRLTFGRGFERLANEMVRTLFRGMSLASPASRKGDTT